MKAVQPSDRLLSALKVGDTLDLFPVFKDWTTAELQALLKDVEEFSAATNEAIDAAWKLVVLQPEAFFNEKLGKNMDDLRAEKKLAVLSVLSEICSVAIFYLNERGVKTE